MMFPFSFWKKRPAIIGGGLLLDYAAGDALTGIGSFSRGSGATYSDASSIIQLASTDVLRDGHYISGVRTTRLEESRTNACLWSEQLDNASWFKSGSTVSANATTAPDGASTADKVVETATTAQHQIFTGSMSFTSGTNYTYSIFGKPSGRDFVQLMLPSVQFGGANAAWFNLTLGTVVSADTGVSARIKDFLNGWYRMSVSKAASATGSQRINVRFNSSASTGSYLGDGTSGIFAFGGQLEEGADATSYYKAEGTSATRSADALSFSATTWSSQLVTQYERWIDSAGAVQTSVTEFTGTTPQALTLNRAYTNVMVAAGSQNEAFFTALL